MQGKTVMQCKGNVLKENCVQREDIYVTMRILLFAPVVFFFSVFKYLILKFH